MERDLCDCGGQLEMTDPATPGKQCQDCKETWYE